MSCTASTSMGMSLSVFEPIKMFNGICPRLKGVSDSFFGVGNSK